MFGSLKAAYDLAKELNNLNLQRQLMDVNEEILAIREENLSLKERVKELESQLSLQEHLTFDGKVYWIEADGKKDGPFCQSCYDNHGKAIRLQFVKGFRGEFEPFHKCLVCKANYT